MEMSTDERKLVQKSATQSGSVYTYSAVNEGTIRLIVLQPSADVDAPVRCSIIEKLLKACENEIVDHYTALSYVWGDGTLNRHILVNGRSLSITSSLDCALRHIRDKTRVLCVWADGVCVNQMDVEDRNTQVRQMAAIYSAAHHTIIFLGASNPKGESIIRDLAEQPPSDLKDLESGSDNDTEFGHRSESLFPDYFQPQQSSPEPPYQLRAGLRQHILSHPWFTRLWTFQELVLSIDPWVQIGSFRVAWDHFCQDVDYPPSQSLELRLANMDQVRAGNKLKLRKQSTEVESTRHFFDILSTRRGVGCLDPRDMIYGHLGLCKPLMKSAISIDYKKSVSQLYQEVAMILARNLQSQGFSILSHVEDILLDDRRPDLPSWAPDWTVGAGSPQSHVRGDLPVEHDFRKYEGMTFSSWGLRAHGRFLDEIKQVFNRPKNYEILLEETAARLRGILAPNITSEDIIIETLITWITGPQSCDHHKRFFAYLRELYQDNYDKIGKFDEQNAIFEIGSQTKELLMSVILQIFPSASTSISGPTAASARYLANMLAEILLGMHYQSSCESAALLLNGGKTMSAVIGACLGDQIVSLDGIQGNAIFRPRSKDLLIGANELLIDHPANHHEAETSEITNRRFRIVKFVRFCPPDDLSFRARRWRGHARLRTYCEHLVTLFII